MAGEETRPAVKQLRKLLNTNLKVKVADGRVMVGNLSCYDQQGNIILSNTLEYVETRSDVRNLGQVLILAKHRVSCEAEESAVASLELAGLRL